MNYETLTTCTAILNTIDSRSKLRGIKPSFFIVKILLLLPLLLGFSVPAIAHNEANDGCGGWEYCEGQNQECDEVCEQSLDEASL